MDTLFNKCSLALIGLAAMTMLCVATLSNTGPTGESQAYMMTTIALENHLGQGWTDADFDQAMRDYPEHAWYFSGEHRNRYAKLGLKKDDKIYSPYFLYYSLAAIPVKSLLKYTGCSQSYAFAITNVLVYVLSMLTVYRYFGRDARQKFIAILVLACYPVPFYIFWPSAEIFILSFVVMSIAFLYANKYFSSALSLSVAGAMQITVMPLALFIAYQYIMAKYDPNRNFKENVQKNLLSASILCACFLSSLVHFAINKVHFGNTLPGMPGARLVGSAERLYAYLFDFNFGILPYFPLFFLLIPVLLFFMKAIKSRVSFSILLLAWAVVTFGFSLHPHINSGMTGIHRYLLWSMVIPLMGIAWFYPSARKPFKGLIAAGLVLSALYMFAITAYTKIKPHTNGHMTPIAKLVLNNYPQWYSPSDFGRFQQRINSAQKNGPWVYATNDSFVRKILLKKDDITRLKNRISANEAFFEGINRQLNDDNYHYISVTGDQVRIIPTFDATELFHHVGQVCGASWCTDGRPGALLFGGLHTYNLKAGRYTLTLWGELKKAENATVDFFHLSTNKQLYVWPLKHANAGTAENRVILKTELEVPEDMSGLHVRVWVGERDDIVLDGWKLTPVDGS